MLVWKEDDEGKLSTTADRIRATLELVEGQWVGILYDGKAKLSTTRGARQESVAHTMVKRIGMELDVTQGECSACEGPTFPYRDTGRKRCLDPACAQFKDKHLR